MFSYLSASFSVVSAEIFEDVFQILRRGARVKFGDSKLWADDVNAAIKALSLDHPILCGWSYGPLVVLDYIRHYGEDAISGINFVGGITSSARTRRYRS